MKIVHVSAECFPVAKVGGLGDVVGALPKYLNQVKDIEAMVVMPYIYNQFTKSHDLTIDHKAVLPFGKSLLDVTILKNDDLDFPLYLVQIEGFSHRHQPYGYDDDYHFYIAFQTAVLNWIHQWKALPSVIHCHDFHTGFIPFMMKYSHQFPKFREIASVFTIHNGEYQGIMGKNMADYLPWFDVWQFPLLVWDNDLNAMASAIKCAWRVTTVSPQYMKELMSQGRSTDDLFRQEASKCLGILNGIDDQVWNPATDENLVKNYTVKNIKSGKAANKEHLCQKYGFNPDYPLISFIGRFTDQKGVDVLADAIWQAISIFDLPINFLVVGSGDLEMESGLEEMNNYLDERYNTYIGYNEAFARLVYAGSDFMVMPSRFEPCGLNQFYTLRYGGVPMVRTVGGLLDSIIDFGDEGGTGIRFIHLSSEDLLHAFQRAMHLHEDEKNFLSLKKNNMKKDFSWQKSAEKYINLYQDLIN
ncbi:Glycogen synthase [Candidatus Ornithobacterium hominis]|uniref:glycogen synthase n=1 Tax=Candidatus Ornithobacterium hominis TaxID=2497989 RepID=UPI0024BC4458|nr:glycogen/starch synthase [Candidatus Ornithobacterium hominis]CAI9429149.1 Glycogen synthase [Candidatus Ornithobacterium hominis]